MAAKKEAVNEAATTETETTKQEVAVKEESGVAMYDLGALGLDVADLDIDGMSGLEEINSSDISVPMGRLLGKDMGDTDKGAFWLPLGTLGDGAKQDEGNDVHPKGEKLENVAILGIFKSRVFFEDDYDPSATNVKPDCRSTDGKVAAPDGKYAGRNCADCPLSQWIDGEKAPCTQQYVLYMSVNSGRPFLMNIKGVAYGPFRKEVVPMLMERSNAVGKSIARANKLKSPVSFPIAGLRLNMWSDTQTTKFGKFPYVRFELNKDNPMFGGEHIQESRSALESFAEMRDENIGHAQVQDGQEDNVAAAPAAPSEGEATKSLEDENLF